MKHSACFHKQVRLGGFACFVFVLLFVTQSLHAQTWTYPMITMSGDTILQTFPPPDSTYIHTRLVMKFRNGVLNKDSLCYDCDAIVEMKNKGKGIQPQDALITEWFSECKETLMAQQFSLNIISDPLVRTILMENGVSYLRRMTWANPCVDTLTKTRLADTMPMNPYNWMIAEFNNDTSVIRTIEELYLLRVTSLEDAEPDFLVSTSTTMTPSDPQFDSAPQSSLMMMGMQDAYQYDVGDSDITVAVVDVGIDYFRCDLGYSLIPNKKVIGGWSFLNDTVEHYPANMQNIYLWSYHGTAVASIIAALTNNIGCFGADLSLPHGMAGIGGGWHPVGGKGPELGNGVKLLGYKCTSSPGEGAYATLSSSALISSILDAVDSSLFGFFGSGVQVVNASWGGIALNSPGLRDAVAEAFINDVSFVVSNAESNDNRLSFPTSYEPPSELIVVGSSNHLGSKADYSDSSKYVDVIAPGGDRGGDTNSIAMSLVDYASPPDASDGPTLPAPVPDSFAWFGGTSAAAPHVSGQVALLRGWYKHHLPDTLAREDVEGIIKASAHDLAPPILDPTDHTPYLLGYDDYTGWGFIRADSMFFMLDPAKLKYKIAHIEVPDSMLHFDTTWSGVKQNQAFFNPNGDTTKDSSHTFNVKVREITGSASYASLGFDTTKKLYAWGNTGVTQKQFKHRGFANELPNWQESWCEVLPDSLNRDLGNGLVPGIMHKYSKTVKLHTYQFGICDSLGNIIRHLPADSNIGMGFTVFGVNAGSSGVSQGQTKPNSFSIWPSIASNFATVTLDDTVEANSYMLIDDIGRIIFEQDFLPYTHHFEINTSDLPSGPYLVRLITRAGNEEAKLIVRH